MEDNLRDAILKLIDDSGYTAMNKGDMTRALMGLITEVEGYRKARKKEGRDLLVEDKTTEEDMRRGIMRFNMQIRKELISAKTFKRLQEQGLILEEEGG